MKELSFAELPAANLHITRIAAVERSWKNGNVNRYPAGRPENIISYTIYGEKEICSGEGENAVHLKAPAIVLISAETPYDSQTILDSDEESGHTICVRFAMQNDEGETLRFSEPFHFWKEDPDGRLLNLFRDVLKAYLSSEASQLQLKACMYRLLGALCEQNPVQELPEQFRRLAPALEYIAANPAANTDVPVLAGMCFLSESYFRTLFHHCTGMTPTNYRNHLRIKKASELLDSSLWTVDMVAEALGFFDTSHFYRVYKKFTGRTPREKE